MKVISWNCNGGFSDKFEQIIKQKADLYVIQEVNTRLKNNWLENPLFPKNNYIYDLNSNKEHSDKKGVLAFSFTKHKIERIDNFSTLRMRYYQYFTFDDFKILHIWTHKSYIEDLVSVVLLNQSKLFKDDKTLLIGDFNSNVIWNNKHEFRSHSDFNEIVKKQDYVSGYHYINKQEFGKESDYTFRLHGYNSKTYYIDYAYASRQRIVDFNINHSLDNISDHSFMEIILKK
ncbi:endonuclease/exonuclease/phosphatase family protein [Apilactobacillus xinyiensis]|uniref:endonuclease/exonuclease/phosphatase family protein n=1 Tax=Apilactobacillus xinyiensis TaxID=2841032 RepID=UPI001C7D8732|nr:endonuclease/exonuclease/phosphatase family protein [Apilactobacillus xinyiensis]